MMKNYTTYETLDFTNDFMFCKILTNRPDLCKELLEIILDVKIRKIECLNQQQTIEITSDGKGIRLDVYVEDDKNTVYDIEMQTTTPKDLPKRSRYYQGMIDLNLIERGAKYRDLKKSIVIFICLTDPFNKGLYAYHFTNICKELPALELQDETSKVFLNASGTKGNISTELKQFLQFLVKKRGNSVFTNELENEVLKARNHEEWRLEYMTLLQRDRENFEQGLEQGIKQGIEQGIEQGLEQGKLLQLVSLVKDGLLDIAEAAKRAEMSVEDFQKTMEEK